MEDSKGKRIEYKGNYGQTHYTRKPKLPTLKRVTLFVGYIICSCHSAPLLYVYDYALYNTGNG